jgi:hypothetical protein
MDRGGLVVYEFDSTLSHTVSINIEVPTSANIPLCCIGPILLSLDLGFSVSHATSGERAVQSQYICTSPSFGTISGCTYIGGYVAVVPRQYRGP